MFRLIVFVASLLGAGQALAQFRCVDQAGAVSFQQAPCSSGAEQKALVLREGNVMQAYRPPNASARSRVSAPFGVEIGMTRGDLLRVLGQPKTINRSQFGELSSHQYVYEWPDRTVFVTVDDGRVAAVQELAVERPAHRQRRDCPTPQAIRDMEFERHKLRSLQDPAPLLRLDEQLRRARLCASAAGSFGAY